jgi:adenine/guanine/hypoxanthine permease
VLYHGLEVLGGGSILTGLVRGAIGVFVIEKKLVEASAFALSGAVLTFFGFMHGESVGLAVTPTRDDSHKVYPNSSARRRLAIMETRSR